MCKNTKRALIVGVTGQDGSYLAYHLLQKGYSVIGTTRDVATANRYRLKRLGIQDDIELITTMPNDFRSVAHCILNVKPTEIYNLAGLTSVGLSFEAPAEANESITNATLNWLEAIRILNPSIKLFNAGSSECFGVTGVTSANEDTSFSPVSPYGIAKASSFWYIRSYRQMYNIKCCTGIMSNHESPLRGDRFVTKKITSSVRSILQGLTNHIVLGDIDVHRDWGWSPEYVIAMHMMLDQNDAYNDYVIATGSTHSLRDFIKEVFSIVGIDPHKHIRIDNNLLRPSELSYSSLDSSRIQTELGWKPTHTLKDIAIKMYHDQLF